MRSIESTYDSEAGKTTYDYASHYDYDLTGDVKTVVQDLQPLEASGHRYKRIDYAYDQLSGKVNYLYYQKGKADQFSLHYRYDAGNRLKEVFSSFIDTVYQSQAMLFWVKEASYQYYLHGPLARTELGAYRVQGLDYAYTLQGWIKALNAAFLKEDRDAGRDGYLQSGNLNRRVARDVFAYALGFYGASDYTPIGGASARIEPAYDTACAFHQFGQPLYNGNIRYLMQQNLATASGAYLHAYAYDQLMRYKAMNTYVPSAGALSAWNITSANPTRRRCNPTTKKARSPTTATATCAPTSAGAPTPPLWTT